ncbi:MAG: L,D-transpeptidase family protein [Gammaproteobacteria bacterium]|nr:L,D-transpeptidase family protein [Gammaproteobacteria bacterium]
MSLPFKFSPILLPLLATLWWPPTAESGAAFPIARGQDLFGEVMVVDAAQTDTLLDIARRYGFGLLELVQANPGVDRWLPGAGTSVILPGQRVLPTAPRQGIVVNVAELRLYYYWQATVSEQWVETYPISVGRMDWQTPLGETKIVARIPNPAWHPPESIRREHAADGDILPTVVPAGPDNPLGQFALRLGIPGYLIHGTNRPFSIGMHVTHGCIRLYPEDISHLFGLVETGTPVYLVNEPEKLGWSGNTLYLEVHRPEGVGDYAVALDRVAARLAQMLDGVPASVEWELVERTVRDALGVPQPIWKRP